jgi:nickel superoxide dismutase
MRHHFLFVTLATLILLPVQRSFAHCEVPCGIYDDQLRFVEMLEDQATIAKAVVQINELSAKSDAQSKNQLVRWITTKEAHATNTQHIVAQYFMTQRIKSDDKAGPQAYQKKLAAAHAVMVAAMKCKQSADAAPTAALRAAIYDFYRAYEGKEPQFDK